MSPENPQTSENLNTAESSENPNTEDTQPTVQTNFDLTATKIREQIIENTYNKSWLYVWGVVTDWKHWEDEQAHLRTEGAIDALAYLAGTLDIGVIVEPASKDGKALLRENALDWQENGPARIEQLEAEIQTLRSRSHLLTKEEGLRLANLSQQRSELTDDVRIAAEIIRYLDNEDIEFDYS